MSKPFAVASLCLLLLGCAASPPTARPPLRVATWNMEHLSQDGRQGCRPRTDADYETMRLYAKRLNADVIAFQEVESAKAAARVFDPGRYDIVIEARPVGDAFACRGLEGRSLTRQAVGFAIRKGVPFERAADVVDLQLGDPNLRSGVDITVRPRGQPPLRLLVVHLKSGCFAGSAGEACQILGRQVPVLERWIDARAAEATRFAVLGDFNRRLASPNDLIWAELDDGEPANADLVLAQGAAPPRCDPRFKEFIDHIVLDARAARALIGFEEQTYDEPGERLSDHCPVIAVLDHDQPSRRASR